MLTLYHAPRSRSSAVVTLLDELGALDRVEIVPVGILRGDGSGARDPANPHPEGKVPYLVHDGEGIRERAAIFAYLTELFPGAGLGPLPGMPGRGAYLSWLAWYQGVMEPAYLIRFAGVESPALDYAFRDVAAVTDHLRLTLERQPWLLGEAFSAADLLVSSPYVWMPKAMPDVPAIRDWVARCAERAANARTARYDEELPG